MGLVSFFRKLFGGEETSASEMHTDSRLNDDLNENPQSFESQPKTYIPENMAEIEKDEEIRTDSFTINDKNDVEEDLND